MRFAAALAAIAGCSASPALTGNAEEDLATLTSLTEVDCNTEPLCGPIPQCMRDALRNNKVGVVQNMGWTVVRATGEIELYPRYLFTYDGSVIQVDDMRSTTDDPRMYETRCPQLIVGAREGDCWSWGVIGCEAF